MLGGRGDSCGIVDGMRKLSSKQRERQIRRLARARRRQAAKNARLAGTPQVILVDRWGELRRRIKETTPPKEAPLRVPIGGGRFRRTLLFYAPNAMNLERDYSSTMGFIYQLRRQAFELGNFSNFSRVNVIADLSTCASIDLPAALLTAAEFDRVRRVKNIRPQIYSDRWCDDVRDRMTELGLPDLVAATNKPRIPSHKLPDIEFVRFRSANEIDPVEAAALQSEIAAKAGIDDPATLSSLEPLIEAVSNAHQHAYPDDEGDCQLPFQRRWWAAGEFNRASNRLRFAVYDQGVGIPKTLPKKGYWGRFQSLLSDRNLELTDADLIAGALDVGRSATDLPGRGLGLDRIRKIAEQMPNGRLQIWSGGGLVRYAGKGSQQPADWQRVNLSAPFSGTLIEWQFDLAPSDSQ